MLRCFFEKPEVQTAEGEQGTLVTLKDYLREKVWNIYEQRRMRKKDVPIPQSGELNRSTVCCRLP